MSDLRSIPIDHDTIEIIEAQGERLLRESEAEKGIKLLALCLNWKSMGQRVFECSDVDESAGMAERLNGDSLPSHDFVGESYYCEVCSLPRARGIHKVMAKVVDLHDFSRRVS